MKINARAVLVMPWLVLVASDRPRRRVPRVLPVAAGGFVVVLVGAALSAVGYVVDQPPRARARGAAGVRCRTSRPVNVRRDRSRARGRLRLRRRWRPRVRRRWSSRRRGRLAPRVRPYTVTARARLGRDADVADRSHPMPRRRRRWRASFGPPAHAVVRPGRAPARATSRRGARAAPPPGGVRRRDARRVPDPCRAARSSASAAAGAVLGVARRALGARALSGSRCAARCSARRALRGRLERAHRRPPASGSGSSSTP